MNMAQNKTFHIFKNMINNSKNYEILGINRNSKD